ncbi:AbrB/MazE/SpoVT family DNA-binding domain-containing protein [bacterium]|nr:AbrB/MazE/SpoVT family DNA-binding domain-containing protein [bacterium]MBU1937867.1 AbrB/MazE/SpoVT family DNA-binding domain-containing protein [bacterium]
MSKKTRPQTLKTLTATARIRSKNQITLPKAISEALGLAEGEFLGFTLSQKRTIVEPGMLILTTKALAERPWSAAEWREREAEADADIKAGRVSRPYKGAKSTIAALKRKSS